MGIYFDIFELMQDIKIEIISSKDDSSIEYAIFYRKYYELQRKQIMTLFSIIIDCQMGMYGVNCVEKCGNCKNNETCDIVNGTCPNGCAAGYNGTVCKDGKLL